MARKVAKEDAGEMPAVVSTLDAPTTQSKPLTEVEKVERFEARRAELRRDPTRR